MARPLGELAISLSGGGLRATGFHLGTLSYLHEARLLEDVTVLSSVSGGSFIGIRYALSVKEGWSFEEFYDEVVRVGREVDLVAATLETLGTPDWHGPTGERNAITALADVYDTFFEGRRLEALWDPKHQGHLRRVAFNATEFHTGRAFRFVYDEHGERSGSGSVAIDEADARMLRLADVMASSSCVPGAFEPLRYPDDCRWPDDGDGERPSCEAARERLQRSVGLSSVPIMDGGMLDNQAMFGALEGMEARQGREDVDFGMLIVSDASAASTDILRMEAPKPAQGPSIAELRRGLVALVGLIVVCLGLAVAAAAWGVASGMGSIALLVMPSVLVLGMLLLGVQWARSQGRRVLHTLPVERPWAAIEHLRVSELESMVRRRLSSFLALSSDVFFDRIRELGYAVLGARRGERAVRQSIDALLTLEVTEEGTSLPRPSAQLLDEVVSRAARMPTKLSLDDSDPTRRGELEVLIACGQATMCWNLLQHVLRCHRRDASGCFLDPAVDRLYSRILRDWEQLREDAFVLVDRRARGDAPERRARAPQAMPTPGSLGSLAPVAGSFGLLGSRVGIHHLDRPDLP